jgi:hypothetical protein
MPPHPPACRLPPLGENRPAASLLIASHQIVLRLASLQRRSQKLVNLHRIERRSMRNSIPEYHPIPRIKQKKGNDQPNRNPSEIFLQSPHKKSVRIGANPWLVLRYPGHSSRQCRNIPRRIGMRQTPRRRTHSRQLRGISQQCRNRLRQPNSLQL